MAFERASESKIVGDSLDVFVSNTLSSYKAQLDERNSQDESNFHRLVLDKGLSLEDQKSYREAQLTRVSDDPTETRRVKEEISSLNSQIAARDFTTEYIGKLSAHESGAASIDSVLTFLQSKLATTTDESLRSKIQEDIRTNEKEKFTISQNALKDQTDYALNDKTASVLDAQIGRVSQARNEAILSGNTDIAASLDLQLQSLKESKASSDIEKASTDFAVGAVAGYHTATDLLDGYNAKIASADPNVAVTIGGVKYDNARQFWQYKRDSYLADQSSNGFLSRFGDEQKQALDVKASNNTLTNVDLANSKSAFDNLSARPELATYGTGIATARQDALQHGTDLRTTKVEQNYDATYDVNAAFQDLDQLKALGGNVDKAQTSILTKAAATKKTQVDNILQTTQQLMHDNPGMTPQQALDQAAKSGAGVVLSPEQLVAQPESKITSDLAKGAAAGNVKDNPATTVGSSAGKPTPPPPAPIPATNDLSKDYGKVGNTIYDKKTGAAFTSEKSFFDQAGVNSFQNLKFDEGYQPPSAGASPALNATPTPPTPAPGTPPTPPLAAPGASATPAAGQHEYEVSHGDTLGAIAQKFLGDATRAKDIATANGIKNPDLITAGQKLIIPAK